ncbi:MAG: hypothetical protein QME58_04030 [Bacteroidota bacterium]|nr:hypothetical protein [Bacteroidota bacterium]
MNSVTLRIVILLVLFRINVDGQVVDSKYPTCDKSLLIGGTVSTSLSINKSNNSATTIVLVPNIVHFFSSGIGLGLNLNYTLLSVQGSSVVQRAIGPRFMLAFGDEKNRVYPYFGADVNYLNLQVNKNNKSGSLISLYIGILETLNINVAIPIQLSITYMGIENSGVTTFSMSAGFVGFFYR